MVRERNAESGLSLLSMNIIRKGTPNWRVHPGEVLREEFLKPMGISPYELAKRLHVPAPRVNDIVLERRGISADTAVRLSRFFGTTEQFWLNLQGAYEISRVKAEHATEIKLITPRAAAAVRQVAGGTTLPKFHNAQSLLTFLPSRPPRDHDCRNPAARTELTFHLRPHRLRPAHNIREHLIHDVLLEDAEVSICLEILL